MSIARYINGKRVWLRLANVTTNKEMRKIYLKSANWCDKMVTSELAKLTVCLLVVVMLLSGCQTIKGFSKDVGSLCDSIDRAIVEPEEPKGEQK